MLAEAGNAFEFSRLGHARSGCALGDHAPGSRVFTYAEKPESVLANHRYRTAQNRRHKPPISGCLEPDRRSCFVTLVWLGLFLCTATAS